MRLFCYKYRFTIPRRKKTTTKEQKQQQQQQQATNGNDTLAEYFQETTEKLAKTLKCFPIR